MINANHHPFRQSAIKICRLFCINFYLVACFKNPDLPQLTAEIIGLTSSEVTMRTNIINDRGSDIFQKGICLGTHQNLTLRDLDPYTIWTNDGSGSGSYETKITGLSETTYYIRSYAVNDAGIGYGNELSYLLAYNYIPHIEITYPPNDNFIYKPGEIIDIYFSAYDTDGTIEKIEVYANDSLITTLLNSLEFRLLTHFMNNWQNVVYLRSENLINSVSGLYVWRSI